MSAPAFLDPVATPARRGGVVVFLAVAFAVTWAIWLTILVPARTVGPDGMPWTFFLASIGPACGAVAAALWEGGARNLAAWARRVFSLRFARVWWLAGRRGDGDGAHVDRRLIPDVPVRVDGGVRCGDSAEAAAGR